jgi:SnoaL-like domain
VNRLMGLLLPFALASCSGHGKMSSQDLANEKLVVQATVTRFWKAYEQKDLTTITKLLSTSGELTFFGTDSAEVIKSLAQWEALMKNDWKLFDSTHFGDPQNVSIQVSNHGELASLVYEVPDVSLVEGTQVESLDRFAMTLIKENGEWRIIQGMTAVATVGQSSADLVARRRPQRK